MTCMMITGIIGNVVVCIVYYKKIRYGSVRYYILVMGVVDLLTCVVVMPMEFVFQLRYDLDYSELECKAVMFVKAGVVGFSGYLLIVVAIDRYRKVCKPTKKQFNEKKAFGVCAFLTILTSVPTMFFTGRNTVHFEGTNVTGLTCFVADDVVGSVFLMQYAWSMVVSLCIGSMVMSVAHVRIARHLLKHKKHMEMYWIHKSKPCSTITRDTMTRSLHINESPTGVTTEACLSSAVDATFLNSPRGPPRTTALSSLCGTSRKGSVEDVRVPEIEATCITTSAGKGEKSEKTATEPADRRHDTEPKMEKDRLLTGTEQLHSAVSDSTDPSEELDRRLSWSDAHAQLEVEPCLTTSDSLQVSTPMSRPIPELQIQRDLSDHLRRPDQVQSLFQSVSRIPTHTTLMLYILTAVFIFNFLPYLSVLIIYGGRDIRYNMFQICVKSYCINCSVNPVIYGFCSAKFRRECFKLFTFRFKF
ncbi:uncharacterized protein [Littorina saxatilis]|uniref:uncharacterized protein n=1 Tax=Littorina saxatilis TaxID=31220 RepID=UPI0038B4B0E9